MHTEETISVYRGAGNAWKFRGSGGVCRDRRIPSSYTPYYRYKMVPGPLSP